jgi:hypothetical protein
LSSLFLKQFNVESASETSQDDSELTSIILQTVTSDTSAFKKRNEQYSKVKEKHTAK